MLATCNRGRLCYSSIYMPAATRCNSAKTFCYLASHSLSSPFVFSLPPINSRITQIRGHIAGSSPPPPHHGTCLGIYIARRIQHVLPSSTSVELCFTHARPSQQLIPLIGTKKNPLPRWDSNSRTNTTSIRG